MLSGIAVEEIVPKKDAKLETDTDPKVSKIADASKLWGDAEDVEQVEQPPEKIESTEKPETAGEDNGNPKSFLKGFSFKNCTVNFQLPGSSFK